MAILKRAAPDLADDLASAVSASLDGAEFGPAMAALNDRQRRFVYALYTVKPGHGSHVRAAKAAGYGTRTTTAKCWSVIAARLAHDSKIQAALHEEDQKRLR